MKPFYALLLLGATLCIGADDAAPDIGKQAYIAAITLRTAGNLAGAEQAAQALVAARTQALGAEAGETLKARLLLPMLMQDQGKYAAAEAGLRERLPIMTRVYGADHEEALSCQSDLCGTLCMLGKYAEAE
jgi:hypothetical protein